MYDKWTSKKEEATGSSGSGSGSSSATKTSTTKRTVLDDFSGGLNSTSSIYSLDKKECRDNYNMDSYNYPALRTRLDSLLLYDLHNGDGRTIGVLNNGHLFVARQQTIGMQQIKDIETDTAIGVVDQKAYLPHETYLEKGFSENYTAFYCTDGTMYRLDETGDLLDPQELHFPTNYTCMHDNRIVAASSTMNTVVVGQQGRADFMYYKYDSFDIGSFTEGCRGIMSYKGNLLYWTETSLYKIDTEYPVHDAVDEDNAYKRSVLCVSNNVGCASAGTIEDVLGNVIWYGNDRVYRFNGSKVEVISGKIKDLLADISECEEIAAPTAGSIGETYYLVFNYRKNNTNYSDMFIYDLETDSWTMADGDNIIDFVRRGSDLISLCRLGYVKSWTRKAESTYKAWRYKSPYFKRTELSDDFIIKATLNGDSSTMANMSVYIRADVGGITNSGTRRISCGTISYTNTDIEHVFDIPSDIPEEAMLSIELEGYGDVTIHSITL